MLESIFGNHILKFGRIIATTVEDFVGIQKFKCFIERVDLFR